MTATETREHEGREEKDNNGLVKYHSEDAKSQSILVKCLRTLRGCRGENGFACEDFFVSMILSVAEVAH